MRIHLAVLTAVALACLPAAKTWAQEAAEPTPADAPAAASEAPAEPAAEPEAEAEPADPSGTYRWEITFGQNTIEQQLTLAWDGENLTGELTTNDQSAPIENGTYADGEVKFDITRNFNEREFVISYAGKPGDDGITGARTRPGRDGAQRETEWIATRHLDAADVVGVWNLQIVRRGGPGGGRGFGQGGQGGGGRRFGQGGPGGGRGQGGPGGGRRFGPRPLTISLDGDQIKVSRAGRNGDREAEDVKIENGKLVFSLSRPQFGGGDGQVVTVYTATVRGDKMTGSAETETNNGPRSFDFTAERAEPEADADESSNA